MKLVKENHGDGAIETEQLKAGGIKLNPVYF